MAPRRKYSPKKKAPAVKAIKRVVNQVIKKNTEIKRWIPQAFARTGFSSLKHLVFYNTAPLQSLSAGSGEGNRVGTDINVKDLHLTITTQSVANASAFTKFRLMVFWSDKEFACPPTNLSTDFVASDLLLTGTYANETINGRPNLKNGNIDYLLYDRIHVNEVNFTGAFLKSIIKRIKIPINRKVSYRQDGFLRDKQLYVVLVPYIGAGTAGVTDFPYFEMSNMITYTDN